MVLKVLRMKEWLNMNALVLESLKRMYDMVLYSIGTCKFS